LTTFDVVKRLGVRHRYLSRIQEQQVDMAASMTRWCYRCSAVVDRGGTPLSACTAKLRSKNGLDDDSSSVVTDRITIGLHAMIARRSCCQHEGVKKQATKKQLKA
jgi:hypothetical protein